MKEILFARGYKRMFESPLHSDDGFPAMGLNYQEERIIKIDLIAHLTRGSLIHTIVHEEFHGVFPEFDEREVGAWTAEEVRRLTPRQKREYINLYKRGKI